MLGEKEGFRDFSEAVKRPYIEFIILSFYLTGKWKAIIALVNIGIGSWLNDQPHDAVINTTSFRSIRPHCVAKKIRMYMKDCVSLVL